MTQNIKKFDTNNITDSVILIIGNRATGKSYLARDLLVKQNNSTSVVISPTELSNKIYSECTANLFIHEKYSSNIIEDIVNKQHSGIAIILDDCLYDKTWINDKNIKTLFMNGRHLKTTLIITLQGPYNMPPFYRSNSDYVFIFKDNNRNNKKKIYENYGFMFPTFDLFSQTMDKYTDDYGCLVLNNTSKHKTFEECVFWYKADPIQQINTSLYSDETFSKRK